LDRGIRDGSRWILAVEDARQGAGWSDVRNTPLACIEWRIRRGTSTGPWIEHTSYGLRIHATAGAAERIMKPINPVPLIAMLVLVVFLYLWLNGYLT